MQQQEATKLVDDSFGQAVSMVRGWRRLSQRAFAKKLTDKGMPVDASAISRIEGGNRSVRLAEAIVIAEVLDVELDFLVAGSRSPSREFRVLRRYADTRMNAAEESIVEFIDAFMHAKRHLEENPELLEDLEDEELGRPISVGGYLDWVGARMDRLKAHRDHVVTRDQREAGELTELAVRFVHGFASPDPLDPDRDVEFMGG